MWQKLDKRDLRSFHDAEYKILQSERFNAVYCKTSSIQENERIF